MSEVSSASSRALVETQAKAKTLLEALPYIQEFSGATVVVKVGGEIADEPERAAAFTRSKSAAPYAA